LYLLFSEYRCENKEKYGASARFLEAPSIGNYLGILALGCAPRGNDFHYIIEKVKSKLQEWKVQQISLARRITQTKFVIVRNENTLLLWLK
jgi:hypothetical protein